METNDGTNAAVAAQVTSIEAGTQLGFDELREANLRRAVEWNPSGKDLGGPFAACELAGEVGEAVEAMGAALGLALATGAICNATKKAERARAGIAGGVDARVDLGRELADVVICADLVAMRLGIDLGAAVVEKFNLTSRERGFETKLDGCGTPRAEEFHASAAIYREQRDALLSLVGAIERLGDHVTQVRLALASNDRAEQNAICESRQRLGIDTDRWRIRDEQASQPAAAGGAA